MTRLVSVATKAALVAVAGSGLYLASYYSDGRGVSKWTSTASTPAVKAQGQSIPEQAITASERRLRAEPGSCASQTWPKIESQCITSRAESAKPNATTAWGEPSAGDVSPPQLGPENASADPGSTGSVPLLASPSLAENAAQDLTRAETRKVKKQRAFARGERRRVREARHGRSLRSHFLRERPIPVSSARAREPIQFRLADRGN
jgi:hypothetical protein